MSVHALEHVTGAHHQLFGGGRIEARIRTQIREEFGEAALEAGRLLGHVHLGADAGHLAQADGMHRIGGDVHGGVVAHEVAVIRLALGRGADAEGLGPGRHIFVHQEVAQVDVGLRHVGDRLERMLRNHARRAAGGDASAKGLPPRRLNRILVDVRLDGGDVVGEGLLGADESAADALAHVGDVGLVDVWKAPELACEGGGIGDGGCGEGLVVVEPARQRQHEIAAFEVGDAVVEVVREDERGEAVVFGDLAQGDGEEVGLEASQGGEGGELGVGGGGFGPAGAVPGVEEGGEADLVRGRGRGGRGGGGCADGGAGRGEGEEGEGQTGSQVHHVVQIKRSATTIKPRCRAFIRRGSRSSCQRTPRKAPVKAPAMSGRARTTST